MRKDRQDKNGESPANTTKSTKNGVKNVDHTGEKDKTSRGSAKRQQRNNNRRRNYKSRGDEANSVDSATVSKPRNSDSKNSQHSKKSKNHTKFQEFPDTIRQTLLCLEKYDEVLSTHTRHDRITAATKELQKQMRWRKFKPPPDQHQTIGFLNSILECADYLNIDGEFLNFNEKSMNEDIMDLMNEFCSDDVELSNVTIADSRENSENLEIVCSNDMIIERQPTCKTSFTTQNTNLLKKWQYLVHAMLDLIVFDLEKNYEKPDLNFEKLILPWIQAKFQNTLDQNTEELKLIKKPKASEPENDENKNDGDNVVENETEDDPVNSVTHSPATLVILQKYVKTNRFCVLSLLLHKLLNTREFVKNINLTALETKAALPFQAFYDQVYQSLTVSKSHQMQMRFAKLIIKRPPGVSTENYKLLPNFFFKYYGDRPEDAKNILKKAEPMECEQEARLAGFLATQLELIGEGQERKYQETCHILYALIQNLNTKNRIDLIASSVDTILHQIFRKMGFNFDYENVVITTTDDDTEDDEISDGFQENFENQNFGSHMDGSFNFDRNDEHLSESESEGDIIDNFQQFSFGFLDQIDKIKAHSQENAQIERIPKPILKLCVDLLEIISNLIETSTVINLIQRIVGQEKTLASNFPHYRVFRCLLERLSECEDMSKSGMYTSSLADVLEFFKKRAVFTENQKLDHDFVKLAKLLFCVPSVPIILDLVNHLVADSKTIKSCKFMVDVFSIVIHNKKSVQLTFALPAIFDKYIINKIYKKCLTFDDPELEIGCLFLIQDFNIDDSRMNLEACSDIIANSLKKVDRLHILGHVCIEWLMTYPKRLFSDDIVIALCQLLTMNEQYFGMHGLVLTAFEALKYYTVVVTQGRNSVGLQ